MRSLSRNLRGALLILASAIGFGLMPILAIYAYGGGANVTTLLLFRFSIAAVVLFGCALWSGAELRIDKRQVLFLALLGGVLYTLQASTYLSSVHYITPSLAALILYTYPVMVGTLDVLLGAEVFRSRILLAGAVSLGGVAMILGVSGSAVNGIGVLLALSAAGIYTSYIMIGNRVVKQLPPLVVSAYVSLFAGLTMLVFGVATHQLDFGLTPVAWWAILGIAGFSTVIGILAFFRGLELVGSTLASILSTAEPLVTALLSALLWGERLSPMQMLGGAAVLLGATLAVTTSQQE